MSSCSTVLSSRKRNYGFDPWEIAQSVVDELDSLLLQFYQSIPVGLNGSVDKVIVSPTIVIGGKRKLALEDDSSGCYPEFKKSSTPPDYSTSMYI
jgi:hypothetical protein